MGTTRPEDPPSGPVHSPEPTSLPSAQALAHLAAALVHEVRNPLNAMNIHVELLETRLGRASLAPELAAAMARSLKSLRDGVGRIDETLCQYLSVVGPSDGQKQTMAARGLLEAAARRAEGRARASGVHLVVEAPDEAWLVDVGAVGLALDTLLDNAIEASTAGGAIALRARRGDESAGQIDVADEGEGMDEEMLEQAQRIGFSTRGRAGLGLKVARQAVKGLGGALILRSEGRGHGTTVSIELPLDEE